MSKYLRELKNGDRGWTLRQRFIIESIEQAYRVTLYRCFWANEAKPKSANAGYTAVAFDDGVKVIRPDGSTVFIK